MPCLKPSLEQDSTLLEVTWDRTPLGLETVSPCQPRAALAVEGSGKTQVPSASKVPALHREAERDTTGSFNRQPLVHTWIARSMQGKRRCAATLRLIRPKRVKLRLTLWFYWGKRAARRHGIVGEPRKSQDLRMFFLAVSIPQRRLMALMITSLKKDILKSSAA